MGGTKQMMDEVASRMEICDPNDPKVLAEVGRLLSLNERRLVVLETHPNSGGCWVGKLGTESEILQYLAQLAKDGTLDYVGGIVELKEKAEEEILELSLRTFSPSGFTFGLPGNTVARLHHFPVWRKGWRASRRRLTVSRSQSGVSSKACMTTR